MERVWEVVPWVVVAFYTRDSVAQSRIKQLCRWPPYVLVFIFLLQLLINERYFSSWLSNIVMDAAGAGSASVGPFGSCSLIA